MRTGQTSFFYFITKIVSSFISFVALVYFARALGEEILGFWALILALVTWFEIPANVGISSAITKRVSEGQDQMFYLIAGFVVKLVLLIFTIIIILLLRDWVNAYVGISSAEFVVSLLVVSLATSMAYSGLKGKDLVHIYAAIKFAKQISISLSQILLVFFGFGLTGLVFGHVISSLLFAFIGLYLVKIKLKVPNSFHFIQLFDFAKYSWLSNLRIKAFNTVDIILLGFFTSAGLVGIYSVAWTLARFLDTFGRAISTTLFPKISEISHEQDVKDISNLIESALAYAGLFVIPGFIGSLIIGEEILQIYGENFTSGAEVLSILFMSILFYSYTGQLISTLNAIDRPDLAFRVNLVLIVTNAFFNIILILIFGWIGAAIATTISSAITFVLALSYSQALIGFSIPIRKWLLQWISAVLMGIIVLGAKIISEMSAAPENNEILVILLVLIGSITYITVLMMISSNFRHTIKNNMPV